MVALSANRLVWLAMSLIRLTISPMLVTSSDSFRIKSVVLRASPSARSATICDLETWDEISLIEADNSSVAEATVWTLVEASSAALATEVACKLVSEALSAMSRAEDCNWAAAAVTV